MAGTPRRKPGKATLKGRTARRQEQRAFHAVCRKFGLTKDQQRELHEAITGLGLDMHGIEETAEMLFGAVPPAKS